MRIKQLEENVRYGQKEQDIVLANLNDFKFGFEIELNPPNESVDDDTSFVDWLASSDEDVTIKTNMSNDLGETLIDYLTGETYEVLYNESEKLKILNDSVMAEFVFDNIGNDMFPFELHYSIVEDIINTFKNHQYDDIEDMMVFTTTIESIPDRDFKYIVLAIMIDADVDIDVIEDSDLTQLSFSYKKYIDTLNRFFIELDGSSFNNGGALVDMSSMDTQTKQQFNDFYDENLSSIIRQLKSVVEEIKSNAAYAENLEWENIHSNDIAKAIESEIDILLMDDKDQLRDILEHFGVDDRYDDILHELSVNGSISDSSEYEQYRAALEGADFNTVFDNLSDNDNLHYTSEYDGQIEIITTEPVSGRDILKHYRQMKTIITELIDQGFTSGDNSGLHMSISYKNGKSGMNFNKFSVLSDMYKITDEDTNAVRNYVNDIFSYLKNAEDDLLMTIIDSVESKKNPINQIVTDVEGYLSKPSISNEPKYHTINFADYGNNGRIELRFFGGDGYENQLDTYLKTLIKFMYILKISSDNSHDTNYYKALVKMTNKVFSGMYGMSIDEASFNAKTNLSLLNKLGISQVSGIADHHEALESMHLQLKKDGLRHDVGDTLELIEENEFERLLIQSETTTTLKLYRNFKQK